MIHLYVFNRTKAPIKVGSLDLRVPAQNSEDFDITPTAYESVKGWLEDATSRGMLSWRVDEIEIEPTEPTEPTDVYYTFGRIGLAPEQPRMIKLHGCIDVADLDQLGSMIGLSLGSVDSPSVVVYFTVRLVSAASCPVFVVGKLGDAENTNAGPPMHINMDGPTQSQLFNTGTLFTGEILFGLSSLKEDVPLDRKQGRIEYAFCSVPA